MARKALEQIFCESYFGIEGDWKLQTRMERLALTRAVAAVEAEVLRRLEIGLNRQLGIKPLTKKAKGKA